MVQGKIEAPDVIEDSEMNFEAPDVLENKDMFGGFDTEDDQAISEYIRGHEGEELKVYDDTSKNKTIGIGHKILPGENLKDITPEKKESMFVDDIYKGIKKAKSLFPDYDNYPLDIKKSLVDGTFRGDHVRTYDTTKLINSGQWGKAAKEYVNRDDYRASKASEGSEKPFTGVYKRLDENAKFFSDYATPRQQ